MSNSISGQELFEMAIQIAEKCSQLYYVLEQRAQDSVLKKTFGKLSAEGQDQMKMLDQYGFTFFEPVANRQINLENSLFYFLLISEAQKYSTSKSIENSASELSDEIGSIQLAVSLEKDSILFWQELKKLTQGELQQKIDQFIERKKERITRLLQIKMNLLPN